MAGSLASFALAWLVCAKLVKADEGVSLGVAGAVLAVVLAVAAWWAPRGTDDEGSGNGEGSGGGGPRLVQKARAGGDVYVAGRDQTIVDRGRRDEIVDRRRQDKIAERRDETVDHRSQDENVDRRRPDE